MGLEFVLAHGLEGGGRGAFEGAFELAATEAFGAAAVVLEEEDEGVIELIVVCERLDDAANALVHVVDHGGVNFHAGGFPFLEFDLVPIADGAGNGPVGIDEAELFHLLEAGFVNGRVAVVVLPFILRDVLGESVHGPVGGGVGDVVEEGFFGVLFEMGFEVFDGVVGDGVGVIPGSFGLVFGVVFGRDLGVVAGEGVGVEEGAGAVDGAEEFIEAALEGPVVLFVVGHHFRGDVPFSGHVGAVSGWLEGLGDGEAFLVEVALVLGDSVVAGHVANAGLVRVESGEEGGAGGAAAAGIVELGEAHAVGSEGVEIGGFDFASVAADVGVAHVIGHDEDDIGPGVENGDKEEERQKSMHRRGLRK